jgi:IS605 OrfB family transposase
MKKAHRHSSVKTMRRASRVYLNELNTGKAATVRNFLHLCHDAMQYFVDLFWQREDFPAELADLETVHQGRDRFGLTTRLSQAIAKQAKELVRSAHAQGKRKPQVRRHTVTLYSHFVKVQRFDGSFDWAVNLIGSGAPRMIMPAKSTAHLNRFLSDGWLMAKTIRLGRDHQKRLFVEFIFEKPRPPLKTQGSTEGMDSNYKKGVVLSDGQVIGQQVYERIHTFTKRQKHTRAEIKSLIGHALKQIDLSGVKTLCIENLKHVRQGTRGKFPRSLNRRMSHWLYAYIADWLARRCEELGIRLERKGPSYTSQTCSACDRCDRRSRVGDRFQCRHCRFSIDADLNAALNLKRLGEAGVYGLRSLPNWTFVT